MKRLLVATLVALVSTACATVLMPNGQSGRVIFLQRGIVLQVVHTCTDKARLHQAGGIVMDILGAEPRDIPMVPAVFGDDRISVTLQSLDATGKVVRTHSATFQIGRSTATQQWIIGDDSGDWGGGGRHSRCRR